MCVVCLFVALVFGGIGECAAVEHILGILPQGIVLATAAVSTAARFLQRPPPWLPSVSSLCPLGTTAVWVPPVRGPSLVYRMVAASCSPPFCVLVL